MKKIIDGLEFKNLIDYGLRNLYLYKDKINKLNVFPVPDGDTGTNMVMTLQNGYLAIKDCENNLPLVAQKFANAIVFGARGNSGVITSQFFKGISEAFYQSSNISLSSFAKALQRGVKEAYKSVSSPAEGTILTVVRESIEHICNELNNGRIHTFNELFTLLVENAKISLENTPELLPILKSAGVVDSGGAGIVYVFEGMLKYLTGEQISKTEQIIQNTEVIDFSVFNEESEFNLGYCTEVLVQITKGKEAFNYESFKQELSSLGDSLVFYYENKKIKIHIHTQKPEAILTLCHKYGEFLSVKIENMSIQHNEKENYKQVDIYSQQPKGKFSVLAVAYDEEMKEQFSNMGADLVILGDRLCPPSSADFLEAFNKSSGAILVFTNEKNATLSAKQAASLFNKSKVSIIETKSYTECYAALPMIDFDSENIEDVAQIVKDIISNIKTATISSSIKETSFNGTEIKVGELVAFSDKNVLSVGKSHSSVVIDTITKVMNEEEKDVITMFINENISESTINDILDFVSNNYIYTEVEIVKTKDSLFDFVLSFE